MTEISVSHDMMTTLAARCHYEVPTSGTVFFGFRGMLPLDVGGTAFEPSHRARLATTDHVLMRCTLGQWRPADGKVALFPGSTVPNRAAMDKARAKGGIGANMLMLGKYAYDRGFHKKDEKSGHRAFRQGMFFPVWRSVDDLDYDLNDILDTSGTTALTYPYDNLHCAYHDNVDTAGYSSSGCQVVCGRPKLHNGANLPETGPWAKFIDGGYGAGAGGQTRFPYLLFSGIEAGMYANAPLGPFKPSLRFGSEGKLVEKVQEALQKKGFAYLGVDGRFGRDTLEALMKFQVAMFGPGSADGIVGPNTAGALGLDWPKFSPGEATGSAGVTVAAIPAMAGNAVPPAWRIAAMAITPKFENQGDPYIGLSGDFDGMGISCGVLQWNIGSNSLQPMVKAVGKPVVMATMPTLGAKMWEAVSGKVTDGLTIVKSWQSGNKLSTVAKAELTALLGSPPMRAQQDLKIDAVMAVALAKAVDWSQSVGRGSTSKREFCWFFDLATQNGNLKGLTGSEIKSFIKTNGIKGAQDVVCNYLAGQDGSGGHGKDAGKNATLWRGKAADIALELLVLSYLRSAKSNPTWRNVVLNRKGAIAMAGGWVNSSKHDFSAVLA